MGVSERLSVAAIMVVAGLTSLVCAGAIDASREISNSLLISLQGQSQTLHVTGVYFLALAALVALSTGLQARFPRSIHR